MSELTVTLAADPAAPGIVRARIRAWLGRLDWPDDETDAVEYAISEAVSNCVEYAYPTDVTGDVTVTARVETLDGALRGDGTWRRRVRATICDQGRWRAPPASPQGRRRGLALMHAFMDTVTVQHHTGSGSRITLLSHVVPAATARTR